MKRLSVLTAACLAAAPALAMDSSDPIKLTLHDWTGQLITTKLMGERLMTAANSNSREGGPIFTSTRFGNVLGSRGSVIPIFREQIHRGGPVTLTDPDMTRFIMSLEGAIHLVIESAWNAVGGEVFITKMPAIRIGDLAVCGIPFETFVEIPSILIVAASGTPCIRITLTSCRVSSSANVASFCRSG